MDKVTLKLVSIAPGSCFLLMMHNFTGLASCQDLALQESTLKFSKLAKPFSEMEERHNHTCWDVESILCWKPLYLPVPDLGLCQSTFRRI